MNLFPGKLPDEIFQDRDILGGIFSVHFFVGEEVFQIGGDVLKFFDKYFHLVSGGGQPLLIQKIAYLVQRLNGFRHFFVLQSFGCQ